MDKRRPRLASLGSGILPAALAFLPWEAAAQSLRVTPEVAVESRIFFDDAQFEDQFEDAQGGFIFGGNVSWTSGDRKTRVLFEPYVRLDTEDEARNYADIRELSVSRRMGDWDVLVGVSQVFWGVAESRNVVDVINQFDTIEDFDQGEKLGQPMVRISKRTGIGTFEAYYLPFFREQLFPSEEGRLRFDPPVNTDAAEFERDNEEWAGDFALRYSNVFGNFDVGLHAFHGTSRTPFLAASDDFSELDPLYQELTQGGIDVQYTKRSWLLKFEGAGVEVGGDTFFSSVSGFEYTFFDVKRSGFDIGVIGEYLYDDRDFALAPINVFENDVFAGTRITLNDIQDTEVLAGAIVDTDTGGVIASAEFQRRFGSSILLEIEGRYFEGSGDPFVDPFADDSHLTLRLTRYF
ncbi:MAG: hypothetical protein AAGH41_08140 [Pseudomonadota bacterium]